MKDSCIEATPASPGSAADASITQNELAWISFIRIASYDTDPPPTLRRVQVLRRLLQDQDS